MSKTKEQIAAIIRAYASTCSIDKIIDFLSSDTVVTFCEANPKITLTDLVNSQDRNGNTALTLAAKSGKDTEKKEKTISFLMEIGANPTIKNIHKKNALDYAAEKLEISLYDAMSPIKKETPKLVNPILSNLSEAISKGLISPSQVLEILPAQNAEVIAKGISVTGSPVHFAEATIAPSIKQALAEQPLKEPNPLIAATSIKAHREPNELTKLEPTHSEVKLPEIIIRNVSEPDKYFVELLKYMPQEEGLTEEEKESRVALLEAAKKITPTIFKAICDKFPDVTEREEKLSSLAKMYKMNMPEPRINTTLATWGIKVQAASPSLPRITIRTSLSEEEFAKPPVLSVISKLAASKIATDEYLVKALQNGNLELFTALKRKLLDSQDLSQELKTSALTIGLTLLINNFKQLVTGPKLRLQENDQVFEGTALEHAIRNRDKVAAEYSRIMQLPYNADELKSAIESLNASIPPISSKLTARKKKEQEEQRKQIIHKEAIRLSFPSLEDDKLRAEAEVISTQQKEQSRLKEVTSNISDIIHRSEVDFSTISLKELNIETILKNRIRSAIKEGIDKKKKKSQFQKDSKPPKEDLIDTLPSSLNKDSIDVYQKAANAVDALPKGAPEADRDRLKDIRDEKYSIMVAAITADITAAGVKLHKLNALLNENGHVCPDIEKYIQAAATYHFTQASIYKDDAKLRENTAIAISKLIKAVKEEILHPENQDMASVDGVDPRNIEQIASEMRKCLKEIGIKESALRVISRSEYEQLLPRPKANSEEHSAKNVTLQESLRSKISARRNIEH